MILSIRYLFVSSLLAILFWQCKTTTNHGKKVVDKAPTVNTVSKPKFTQGVQGRVTLSVGNLMPSPDAPPRQPRGYKGVNVCLFNPLVLGQNVEGSGPIFPKDYKPHYCTQTDSLGYYQIQADTGIYTLMVEVPEGWFANSFDGRGFVQHVIVTENRKSTLDVDVNHNATY